MNMSEEHSFGGQGQISIHLASTSYSVAPGSSVTIAISLHNQGQTEGFFELSVTGIPAPWVFIASPVVRLTLGEQREVPLTIQAPAFPQGRAGRHRLVVRAANQSAPADADDVECTLTVAALEVPGRIGLLLSANEFPVVPGEGITIPIVLLNQGLEGDILNLAVDGIPTAWVSTTAASTSLSPGQQREVSLTIRPPRSLQTGAGRHPFKIQAMSQAAPGQMAEADCILTIATFAEFSGELRPQRVEAGEPARVIVENQGNIQQTFTVTHQSPEDAVVFEPAPTLELRVPPGEVAMAEFQASPRRRPFLGGEVTLPFTTRVQAADQGMQNLRGEVVARPLIPSWVLPAVLILIMALACLSVVLILWEGAPEGVPTEPPAVEAPPTVEQPAPTDVPPTVVPPTEPPPEQPPTEPPPEQPPTEPPPEQPTDEAGGGPGEPGGPCAPIAAPLILVPPLVMYRKRRRQGGA
jgi:uncharacterized membrane protein